MEKKKAVFVTGLCAVMLILIIVGLNELTDIGFMLVVGALAICGFCKAAFAFYDWLTAVKPEKLDPVFSEEPTADFVATYDEIKAELRRDEA